MPGTDPLDVCRHVFEAVPELPFLPELPTRGVGADLVGRGTFFLADMPVDVQPSGWRLVPRPGRDARRTRELLARDLDALEEVADGYSGPLKLAVAGPWTLAANVELQRGHKALADPGAVRDLAEALAAGVAAHVADVGRRIPGASIVLQVDEPSLPAVLEGHILTPSGYSVIPAVEDTAAIEHLALVLAAGGAFAGVHCCAPAPPVEIIRRAGAAFAGLDATLLGPKDDDAIGESIEAGMDLMLGAVSGAGEELSDVRRTVTPIRSLWRRLGFSADRLGEVVTVTPTCGLAGASDRYALAALRRCREAGRALAEDPDDDRLRAGRGRADRDWADRERSESGRSEREQEGRGRDERR